MANDIGSVKGISGSSMALNGQAGQGGHKPSAKGTDSPGGTKPPRPEDKKVEINK